MIGSCNSKINLSDVWIYWIYLVVCHMMDANVIVPSRILYCKSFFIKNRSIKVLHYVYINLTLNTYVYSGSFGFKTLASIVWHTNFNLCLNVMLDSLLCLHSYPFLLSDGPSMAIIFLHLHLATCTYSINAMSPLKCTSLLIL
jgi:hypothetical protein